MSEMKKFGTFGGVFTPTLLTILGVILYLRLGWVVGNAGLLGAWLIIIVSFVITTATAMSMASITTNIRIGAGGAYAIISQSLGLEVGGSLGIPRYISQGLAVTMYIFGFREGWLSIFPTHDAFLIDLITFLVLFGIAYKSADLAIKTQYIIMAVIIASLVAIVFAAYAGSMTIPAEEAAKWGTFRGSPENNFEGADFWMVFAVFFPAATGIMAGANMSGELLDPRESIPKGTLWAIGISFVIYMVLAFWIARSATEQELISNYNIMIERSIWPPIVIAGVLGATFSSALASILGSSRILFAMGEHRVAPKGKWLAYQNKTGQPVNSMIVTGIMVFLAMLLRDLNAIAPLVTMFFLITYAMLNVVVIIEQNLDLISFRPIFKVNKFVPWVGLIGSLFAMFIISPIISLISWALIFVVYGILSRSDLQTPFEDVRSGLFSSFSEWAAKRTAALTDRRERAWKPNLLVPTTEATNVRGAFSILQDITYPKGATMLMGIGKGEKSKGLKIELDTLAEAFRKEGVFSSTTLLKTQNFGAGVNFSNQALGGSLFKPNIIFLNILESNEAVQDFPIILAEAHELDLSVIIYGTHPRALLGQKQNINVWVKPQSPDWDVEVRNGSMDLALLIAFKLKQNWDANIRLISIVEEEEEVAKAQKFLAELVELARLPITDLIVKHSTFNAEIIQGPLADLNIFGISADSKIEFYKDTIFKTNTTCMFLLSTGHENILA